MTYIPISTGERDAMLGVIGVKSLDDLFKDVPAEFRFPTLDLPPALTEMEAAAELADIAESNEQTRADLISFLGAGAYNHYIPSVVDHILRRGEFYTAYTPYQPEISQGTLQAIFEYQSLLAALTGMEVSNASHYDGATAAAEAVNSFVAVRCHAIAHLMKTDIQYRYALTLSYPLPKKTPKKLCNSHRPGTPRLAAKVKRELPARDAVIIASGHRTP